MIEKIKKLIFTRTFLGVIIGMVGGFAYYYFIGCNSGSCPITSNPYISILYGALLGGVLFFKPKKKKEEQQP
ncbi:MAG: hypothetical protein HPY79_04125 [Bacteroidales bacterium]|nr:hypothetical protein [Bacteroidales bacterium]